MEGNNTETVQQPTPEQPAVEQPVAQGPKKPFYKKGLFWGVVTAIAAVAGAVTAYVVLGKDAESAE
jgi:hypothetical protein